MKCDSPHIVNLTEEKSQKLQSNTVAVPCGKCYNCKRRRIAQWSLRLIKEQEVSTSAHFLTLTYDSLHVPITENGFMTLCKNSKQNEQLKKLEKRVHGESDISIQAFFKRLRYYEQEYEQLYERKTNKIVTRKSIRYYLAGEYGAVRKRPHYHCILFNLSSITSIEKAWATAVMQNGVAIDWISFGSFDIQEVNSNTIEYTLKYICKDGWNRQHKNDDRQPEFALMSKGLGKDFLTPDIESFYNSRLDINYMVNAKGHKVALPRYYRDKLMTEETRENAMQILSKKMEEVEEQERIQFQLQGRNYEQEKQSGKIARQAKMKNYSKRNID